MNKTLKITFGGILTAFSVIVLMLGNIPFAEYIGPTFSAMLLVWSVIEMGIVPSLGIYVATSLLAFFLSGNKEPAILYIAFFGYFPILKNALDKFIKIKVIVWLIKLAVFNLTMIGAYALLIYVFGMPIDEFEGLGKYTMYLLLASGNLLLIVFDLCINRLNLLYILKWQPKFHNMINKTNNRYH